MMKSGEVVLSLAAQLASWRAVLVLLRTWATCKPWQRKDFHQYSIFLGDCLNHPEQTVRESASCAAVTESRTVGKGRRKRRYADVDGPGAKPEPELGPRGPTLKKQVLKGFDWLDLRLGLQPANSVDITQDFEWEREARARDKDSSSEESSLGEWERETKFTRVGHCESYSRDSSLVSGFEPLSGFSESMDPAGSPSSIRKVADTARSSPSSPAATVWRSLFCLGNGK